MASRKTRLTRMKVLSMFSVVRGYNIPIIALAQYLSAIFILAPEEGALNVILDLNLFLIVLASSLTIASGYIINNFYDAQKDLINRPKKSMLDRLVSQATKLKVYFALNFTVVVLALIVSWKAGVFFSMYIFLIWFYSHKLKKYPIIGNLTAALLAVLPFFGILMYFKNFYQVIFAHATFLFLLLLIREIIKDLENIRGDIVADYQTIPVRYGEKTAKATVMGLTFLTVIPVYLLVAVYDVGYMDMYFYGGMIVILYFLTLLWKSETQKDFLKLHNLLKLLIVAGVLSIVLIEPSVLLHGRNLISIL